MTNLTFTHPRSTWATGSPVNGPLFDWSTVDFVVIHWPGHDGVPDGDIGDRTDIGRYIRQAHEGYLSDPKRGYSLGYGCMVDYLGGSWQVRGEDFRCASNAPQALNRRAFSINYLTDLNGNTTSLGIAEVNRIIAQVRKVRPAVRVVPHGDGPKYVPGATPTACPGRLAELVHAGVIGAQPEPPAPPPAPIPTPGGNRTMIPAAAKTTDGAFLCQPVWHGPIYTIGDTAQHDITVDELFSARFGGVVLDVASGSVVDRKGWNSLRATLTNAQVRQLMTA